jgi:hypothetical protein
MAYVVIIHATFDTKSDADFIYDQAKQVATTASVARIGSAGERTSHCGVFDEQPWVGLLMPQCKAYFLILKSLTAD